MYRFILHIVFLGIALFASAGEDRAFPRAYPYNANYYKIIDENGKVFDLLYNPLFREISGSGWNGNLGDRGALYATRNDKKYVFRHGFLESITFADGTDSKLPVPEGLDGTIDELFPRKDVVISKSVPKDIWQGDNRLRWFYNNPNKTSLLFVFFAIISFYALFYGPKIVRKRLSVSIIYYIFAAVFFGCSVFAVLATRSRGGFLSLVAGLFIILFFWATRNFTRKKLFISLSAILIVAGLLFALPGAKRVASNLFKVDESNSLRVNILKAFPRMLHDAPGGWGGGQSGIAYVSWYRPDSELHLVRTLIGSHFTWLAEMNWRNRSLYIFAWAFILFFLATKAKKSPLPLSVWAALFIAMFFNHVGEVVTLWVVPGLVLLPALKIDRTKKFFLCASAAALAGGLAACCVTVSLARQGEPKRGNAHIEKAKDCDVVIIGGSPDSAQVYFVLDTYATGGWMFAGKELLSLYESLDDDDEPLPAVAVTDCVENLPQTAKRIVLTGTACEDYIKLLNAGKQTCKAESVIFVSPSCDIQDIPQNLADQPNFRVIVGNLALARMKPLAARPPWLRVVRGAELYIPNWQKICLTF